MEGILKRGDTLYTETSGQEVIVGEYLGGGGQGEVYHASMGNNQIAVKWYLPHSATPEQKGVLDDLVKAGSPSRAFLWPLEVVKSNAKQHPGFGYIMPLREKRFRGMVDLMKERVDPSFRALALVGHGLAYSYSQLHAKGWCYRDINFGNVFFDPQTGETLICDNDNVGATGSQYSGVVGTSQFMAPEVIRGEERPSTQTDLHSLAVLLFLIFMLNHPLEGEAESRIHCLDPQAMLQLYGTHPVFIFDPFDGSNRPDQYHACASTYWNIYPLFLRGLFTTAFTDGLRNPGSRIREGQWAHAMIRLHDSIVYCRNEQCRAENFYNFDVATNSNGHTNLCWRCGRLIPKPLRLHVRHRSGHDTVALTRQTKLYPHHTESLPLDMSRTTAEVTLHPTDPTGFGLTNRSQEKWSITFPDGRVTEVEPGRSVRIGSGTRVHFGIAEGEMLG